MYEVKGVRRSEGEFHGRKFAGYVLHVQSVKDNVVGVTCGNYFVKDSAKNELLEKVGLDVKQWLDKKIEIFFDNYKKPSFVQLVK